MKQVIVLISSIALGVAIATLVVGLRTQAADIVGIAVNQIGTLGRSL
ncbi:MAG: hypothetical protein IJU59_01515 [Firmicutes bacterium]|nr:hypothetical protein [Bacillota bacterium]